MKFEYYFGDSKNSDADIKIFDAINKDKNNSVLGYATFGSVNTKRIRGDITIYKNAGHQMGMRATVIHELAHVLGLDHTDSVFSIMSPYLCSFFMYNKDTKQINTLYPAAEKTNNNNDLDLSK